MRQENALPVHLAIKYRWEPQNIPALSARGKLVTLSHAKKHLKHYEIRDTVANAMKDVTYDVKFEPKIQPLEDKSFVTKTTTTEVAVILDTKANGLRDIRFNRAVFDVKTFNIHAKSCPRGITSCIRPS